jgi:hypothetical protein
MKRIYKQILTGFMICTVLGCAIGGSLISTIGNKNDTQEKTYGQKWNIDSYINKNKNISYLYKTSIVGDKTISIFDETNFIKEFRSIIRDTLHSVPAFESDSDIYEINVKYKFIENDTKCNAEIK